MKRLIILLVTVMMMLLLLRLVVYIKLEKTDFQSIDKGEYQCDYASPRNTKTVKCYYLKEYNPEYGGYTFTVTLTCDGCVVYYGYDGAGFNVKWLSENQIDVTYYDRDEEQYKHVLIDVNNGFYNEWDTTEVTRFLNRLLISAELMIAAGILLLLLRRGAEQNSEFADNR